MRFYRVKWDFGKYRPTQWDTLRMLFGDDNKGALAYAETPEDAIKQIAAEHKLNAFYLKAEKAG